MPQNWQNVSMTLNYHDQIGRNSSKIIPRLINNTENTRIILVCRDHNIIDLLQREHHEILAETGIRHMTRYITYLIQIRIQICFKHNLFYLFKFVWLANIKPKRIASALRGFLAAARLLVFIGISATQKTI